MSRTTTLIRTLVLTAVAALAVMAGAGLGTASADGPTLTVGTGCAANCIAKALVTTTTTTAKVELATTVLAHLTVSVVKDGIPAGGGGGLTTNPTKTVSISAFSQDKTAWFAGLDPDTTYAISVRAKDLKGQINTRKGTFKTLAVQTTGQSGADSLDSGLGCSVQCITQATFVQPKPLWSVANVEIKTGVDALIKVVVSTDKPTQTAAGPVQHQIVFSKTSAALGRSVADQIENLRPASTYYAVVRATDAQGRVSVRQGSFRTVDATAVVTIHKLKIVNDGDKGINRGELLFRYFVDGEERDWTGWKKLSSGSVVGADVSYAFDLRTKPEARINVAAEECDAVRTKNCPIEAGFGNHSASAGGKLNFVNLLMGAASMPGWLGTGITAPAGHDAYFVMGSGNGTHVKFLALATLDLEVRWPS